MYKVMFNDSIKYVQVVEVIEFDAIGCNADHVYGAMMHGANPREAVGYACEISPYCSEPIETYTISF